MRKASLRIIPRLILGLVLLPAAAACRPPVLNQTSATPTPKLFRPGDPTATPLGEDITHPDYLAGKDSYWAANYEEVLPLMQAVLDRDPRLAPPHWYRGMAYFQLGDCASGLDEMELALELAPDYPLALADRGLMKACLGREGEAIADYIQALSRDPSLAKVHQRLGAAAFDQGDYGEALEEHTLAVEIDPTRASAWFMRAQALQMLARFEECRASATKALEVDRELWDAYATRAVCAYEMEEYEAGLPDQQRYVAAVPGDFDGWYNLGIAYRETGQTDLAIEAYIKALSIDSAGVEAMINLGSIYIDLGRFEEAVTMYDRALNLGEIPAAYNGRGEAHVGLGQFEEAQADFERSIDIMPYIAFPYCRLVNVYFQLGRFRDAVETAHQAERAPTDCGQDQNLLELHARAYFELGLYDQAIEYMDRALEQGTYAMAFYYRGIAHDEAGHSREATMDLQTFVDLARARDIADDERTDAEARLAKLRTMTPTPAATSESVARATQMSPKGIGPIRIEPGEALTFRIVHIPPILVEMVGSVFLYFEGVAGEGPSPAELAFTVWDRDTGEWSDNQAHNQIPAGSSLLGVVNATAIVDVHGEFLVQITNHGSTAVTIDRFETNMLVLTTDGQTLELGTLPTQPP
ncbi:MAG TPA: tetratricopeptide repeat protein [Anaerolineales bacterium]|nr:tetratricopeptide repeat protein [Anaerolineales bacterium]